MSKRLLNLLTLFSTAVFGLTLIAWAAANFVDSRRQFISLSHDFHVSIDARGVDARLEVFNDASYGPYRGSIFDWDVKHSTGWTKTTAFGDVAGLYFRLFQFQGRNKLWTLSLSLAYPLAMSAILPAIWLIRHRKGRSLCYHGFPVNGVGESG